MELERKRGKGYYKKQIKIIVVAKEDRK